MVDYKYHSFPFEIPRADGIEIHASQQIDVVLESWKPDAAIIVEGSVTVPPAVFWPFRTGKNASAVHSEES